MEEEEGISGLSIPQAEESEDSIRQKTSQRSPTASRPPEPEDTRRSSAQQRQHTSPAMQPKGKQPTGSSRRSKSSQPSGRSNQTDGYWMQYRPRGFKLLRWTDEQLREMDRHFGGYVHALQRRDRRIQDLQGRIRELEAHADEAHRRGNRLQEELDTALAELAAYRTGAVATAASPAAAPVAPTGTPMMMAPMGTTMVPAMATAPGVGGMAPGQMVMMATPTQTGTHPFPTMMMAPTWRFQ
jgi:hypothetical protein